MNFGMLAALPENENAVKLARWIPERYHDYNLEMHLWALVGALNS